MEAVEREYFVRRLNEEADAKIQAKRVALFGPAGRPEQPTWGMVFEGIKNGDITLREDKVNYTGPYLNPSDVVWPAMEAKQAELEDYITEIRHEKEIAMDAVMLNKDALAALAKFQAI